MLTAIVLAHNETESLEKSVKSVLFADQVIVVADTPTASTGQTLKRLKVKTFTRALDNDYSAQRNYALDLVKNGWVLFLDADEEVSVELAEEISRTIQGSQAQGYYLHRVDYMWGKTMHHGDVGNVYLLRLGLKGYGRWVGRVHEIWKIPGPVPRLNGVLRHTPHRTLADFLQSINRYSSIRAGELAAQKADSSLLNVVFYPVGKFLYLWIIKLGFLDGVQGFIHAMIMSFYSFLSRGKYYLMKSKNS